MRITSVEPVLLSGPSSNDRWISVAKRLRTAAFVEVRTDNGLVGVGETYVGYFAPELVAPVVDYVRPILLAADEVDVAVLTNRMRRCLGFWARVGVGSAILSGVEAALWDLAGQAAGVPVYELLGGARHERLRLYATGGPSLLPVDSFRRKLDRYLELGFTAMKVATGYLDLSRAARSGPAGPEASAQVEVDKLEMMRAHLGPDVGIALDGHMGHRDGVDRWDGPTAAAALHALAPYDLLFFEEPLAYDDPEEYAQLRAESTVPIAGGEQLTSAEEFRLWTYRGAFDIVQPDAAWLGLSDFMTVGVRAAADGAGIASHSWSAGGGVMQNLHAAFACSATVIVEGIPDPGELHTRLWGDNFVVEDGHVLPPQAPGLGVQLSDETKNRFPFVAGVEEFSSVPGKVLAS
ncbi:MAG TPA: mandelate racemase/muconate lactonizing enzyme family protein [Jatrophihabitantaceae bacterium]